MNESMNYWEKKSTIPLCTISFDIGVIKVLGIILLAVGLSGCAFRPISRYKNISYVDADTALHCRAQSLNVFTPRNKKKPKEVLVFLHGGNWCRGQKSTYNFFGNRMARKNVAVVIIDYPLSPSADYRDMGLASAQAVKWVKSNINKYGGNPDRIFVSGHSSGGHLAALISTDNTYFKALAMNNPIRGAILLDAAGLDLPSFIRVDRDHCQTNLNTFSSDTMTWLDASPLYHVHPGAPPMLVYAGERTYPIIREGNDEYVAALQAAGVDVTYHVLKHKKHVPVITQFFWPYNPCYRQITSFMKTQSQRDNTSIARNH